MKPSDKVVVIGLDGATFSLLRPLVREGVMPNLARLLAEGVSGGLRSSVPPYTATAWTSFATGKNPGKHGVYDFLKKHKEQDRNLVINTGMIAEERLWNTLSRCRKKVGVLNFPISFPPEEVNGFMISGFLSPRKAGPYSYPKELYEKLKAAIGDYVICFEPPVKIPTAEKGVKKFVDEILKINRMRSRAVDFLRAEYRPDFLFVVFMSTDVIQHKFWGHLENAEEKLADTAIRTCLLKCYAQLDDIIGGFLSSLDENSTLIVMSDHGFCAQRLSFKVNQWLWDRGYLRPQWRRVLRDDAGKVMRLIQSRFWWGESKKMGAEEMAARQPERLIDRRKTVAFFRRTSEQGIHLNLKGRERDGIVEPGEEYERLRSEIIEKITEYREENSSIRPIEAARRREDIYRGPYVEEAPDIVLIPREGCVPVGNFSLLRRSCLTMGTLRCGSHSPEGIFLAFGNGIKKGGQIEGAEIVDLAPTILYLLGVPIPEDMDGKVLGEIFEDGFRESVAVNYSVPVKVKAGREETGYSGEDEQKIIDRLKGLGYLE